MTNFSQPWQFRFHGHAPPRTTGWKWLTCGVPILVQSI